MWHGRGDEYIRREKKRLLRTRVREHNRHLVRYREVYRLEDRRATDALDIYWNSPEDVDFWTKRRLFRNERRDAHIQQRYTCGCWRCNYCARRRYYKRMRQERTAQEELRAWRRGEVC